MKIRCLFPFSNMVINAETVVTPCCQFWFRKDLGRLTQHTVDQIWNGQAYQQLRHIMYENLDPQSFCNSSTCPYLQKNSSYDINDDSIPIPPELLDEIRQRKTVLNNGPYSIDVANDFRCNLNCIMCSAKERRDHDSSALDVLNAVENYLPKIRSLILLSSGEPFAIPELCDYLSNFNTEKYPNLSFMLKTNAILLTPQRWNSIRHLNISLINVSIDAATRETYEKIRRGGNWNLLLKNLKFLAEKQKNGEIGELHVNMTVMRSNHHEITAFARLALDIGVSLVYFFWVHSVRNEMIPENKDWECLKRIHDQLQDPIMKDPRVNADYLFAWRDFFSNYTLYHKNNISSGSAPADPPKMTCSPNLDYYETFHQLRLRVMLSMLSQLYTAITKQPVPEKLLKRWDIRCRSMIRWHFDGRFFVRLMARSLFSSEHYLAQNRSARQFVTDCYWILLRREPNENELIYWSNLVNNQNRQNVLNAFLISDEFCNHSHYAFRPALSTSYTYRIKQWFSKLAAIYWNYIDLRNEKKVFDSPCLYNSLEK